MKIAQQKQIEIYQTKEGEQPFINWFESLKDKSIRDRIKERLDRVALGNLGDHKAIKEGVSELRFTFDSGYRMYYAEEGSKIILLLCGGDKTSQKARHQKSYCLPARLFIKVSNMEKSINYEDYLVKSLQNPEEAVGYLNAALEGGDINVFLLALQNVIKAQGGISQLAEKNHKSRTSLYKALSKKGNPYLKNTNDILSAIGMHLSVARNEATR